MESFEFEDDANEIDDEESVELESFSEEDVFDEDEDEDVIDDDECFCFNCEQTVDPEEDLKECENCGVYFYVCTACNEEILADENMCFHCQEEEFL